MKYSRLSPTGLALSLLIALTPMVVAQSEPPVAKGATPAKGAEPAKEAAPAGTGLKSSRAPTVLRNPLDVIDQFTKRANLPGGTIGGANAGVAREGILNRLKLISEALREKNYAQVRYLLRELNNDHGKQMSAKLLTEWMLLRDSLELTVESLESKELQTSAQDADEVIKGARTACLTAKSSSDLEPILLKLAPVQEKFRGEHTDFSRQVVDKLSNTADSLKDWGTYLDLAAAGNIRGAARILEDILSANSRFTILTQVEVRARLQALPSPPASPEVALKIAYEKCTGPEGLPELIANFRKIGESLEETYYPLDRHLKSAEALLAAWNTLKAGRIDSGTKRLLSANSLIRDGEIREHLEPIRLQVERLLITMKAVDWTKIPPTESQEATNYFQQLLTELVTEEKYAEMLEVINFQQLVLQTGDRGPGPGPYVEDERALEDYLAAQRFIAVEDYRQAISKLRQVATTSGTKFAPQEKALAQLKELLEEHPQAIGPKSARSTPPSREPNDVNPGMPRSISQEIRELRQEIQDLRNELITAKILPATPPPSPAPENAVPSTPTTQ